LARNSRIKKNAELKHMETVAKFAYALSKVKKDYPPELCGDLDCLLFDMECLKRKIISFLEGADAYSKAEQRLRLYQIQIEVEGNFKMVLHDVSKGLSKVLGPL
jgi:hypothetical protein